MQVGKWGNSLAVRIPASVAEALRLREGDEVRIEVGTDRVLRVARDGTRDAAVEQLRLLGWHLPDGFRFDREDAHGRGA